MLDLSLRHTRTYVGAFAHLDDWTSIGSAEVLSHESKLLDEQDMCDPTEIVLQVAVSSDASPEDIDKALRDSFTQVGCAHEHDCCGCTSTYVQDVTQMPDGNWQITQRSSRNY